MNNFKRIMSMILLVIVATVAFGCTPKNDNIDDVLALVECRAQAIAEIESYAQSKGQDNYLEEDWIVIQEIVRDTITAIQTSNSKDEIAGYVVSAKTDIDGMQTKQQKEAILKELALIAELEKYAQSKGEDNYYVYNWGVIERIVNESKTNIESSAEFSAKESIVSEAKSKIDEIRTKVQEDSGDLGPEPTNEEDLKYRARQWYFIKNIKEKSEEYYREFTNITLADIEEVQFGIYLGSYNDSVVATYLRGKYGLIYPAVWRTVEVEGYEFGWTAGLEIEVYKNKEIYSLYDAYYEAKILSLEDIKTIHEIYCEEMAKAPYA